MERILQHVKPERRNKELERNPVHPIFWKRSFHFETIEQGISFFIPAIRPLLKLSGLYQRALRNALDVRKTAFTYRDPQLPPAFDGFRILFLSDLHIDGTDALVSPLCEVLDSVEADLCILGGDYRFRIHGPFRTVIDHLKTIVAHIQTSQGIVGILGNHDSWEMIRPMERLGIVMLINEAVEVQLHSQSIWLLGLDDPHYYECDDYAKANQNVPEDAFRVLAVHATGALPRIPENAANLCLCGHTHAGQISLPFIGAPITHSALKGPFTYGQWQYGNVHGYTTSGVGTSGVPVRFNTRPEVAVLTLLRSP
jgi:predicted MPP superfamily phosphohydrolase